MKKLLCRNLRSWRATQQQTVVLLTHQMWEQHPNQLWNLGKFLCIILDLAIHKEGGRVILFQLWGIFYLYYLCYKVIHYINKITNWDGFHVLCYCIIQWSHFTVHHMWLLLKDVSETQCKATHYWINLPTELNTLFTFIKIFTLHFHVIWGGL